MQIISPMKLRKRRWTAADGSPREAWVVDFSVTTDGVHQRHRRSEPTRQRAVDFYNAAARDVAGGSFGRGPTDPAADDLTIPEAIAQALASTRRRDASRRDWQRSADQFLAWLARRHPTATHWRQLTRQMLREYLATLAHLSDNSRRLYMQPVLQTSARMHRERGCPNVGERMGLGTRLVRTPSTVYLADVAALREHLRDTDSHLEVGVALQGLAGLQVLEALRLTWDNVDLVAGLIEITGDVKNEYRNRVIPVAAAVLDALRRADERRRARAGNVRDLHEHVVVGVRGEPYTEYRSYCRQVRTAIRGWNRALDWAAKDLRNCLPTFAKLEGIHGTIWEQYIGHAPGTVTDRHYVPRLTARTFGESAALTRAMELFRRFVIAPIEAAQPPASLADGTNVAHGTSD